MVFGVLGPVMLATGDPVLAWKVGMAVTVAIGARQGRARRSRATGPAGWCRARRCSGSIAGVAILLIAFLPMLKVLRDPLVGLVALVVLLLALLGRRADAAGRSPAPSRPCSPARSIFWGRAALGGGARRRAMAVGWRLALPVADAGLARRAARPLPYLSIALPFALVTIIGGIDNTESAAAAGDEYRTRDVLLTEALATVARRRSAAA